MNLFTTTTTIIILLSFSVVVQCNKSFNQRYEQLYRMQPKVNDSLQEKSVQRLLQRLLPNHFQLFKLIVDRQLIDDDWLDQFIIETKNDDDGTIIVCIKGTTGVAVANGIHFYLKYIANCSVSWSGDQLDVFTSSLNNDTIPTISDKINIKIKDKFRYYQNTCTASYSNVWWNWTRWQREIDWMALHGINLPLAFNGQELVYRRTFQRFNMSVEEIDDYFTGPAFLAWNRMGNIQSWSGPLSEEWHHHQYQLQVLILKQMRHLGMYPVVPGFAGHVSRYLKKHLQQANISRLTDWNNFGANYSFTHFLEPIDSNFIMIGKALVQEYIKLYGSNHFYNIDLFNEERPNSNDPSYLKQCGKNVYESIASEDTEAIWVMQGWLFLSDGSFWKEKQVQSLLTSIPMGKMLILDLFSEIVPVYQNFHGYYGQPFIWCMLHNFGGTHGLYGAMNRINRQLYDARNLYRKNMIGIGLTMEGIEQNDIVYDFMTETSWHDGPADMANWFNNYVHRRYGSRFIDKSMQFQFVEKAWQLLRISVYTDTIGIRNHGQYIITMAPKPSMHSQLSYDPRNLTAAVKLINRFLMINQQQSVELLLSSETFTYDAVDMNRQALQLVFDHYYGRLDQAWIQRNKTRMLFAMQQMEVVLDIMEEILQANQHWLLDHWIKSARNLIGQEGDYYEWQARNQITCWGPNDNVLDYAAKQWSGMFQYYYKPRWLFYFRYLIQSINDNDDEMFDVKKFHHQLMQEVEIPFTRAKNQKLIQQANVSSLLKNINRVIEYIEQMDQQTEYEYGYYQLLTGHSSFDFKLIN